MRTRKVGHFFPGGTVDAFDVWVELEAVDDKGRVDLPQRRGRRTAGSGPVEPGAHFYRSLLLDENGNPINKRNAWMARSVAYVRAHPARRRRHHPLPAAHPGGRGRHASRCAAKVNYRKFAWWNTQWAFAGVRDPGTGHVLGRPRTTTTATGSSPATRPRSPAGSRRSPTSRSRSWPRDTQTLKVAARGAAAPSREPLARARVGARALERLRHRPAPAGRPQGRGGGVPEGHPRWSPATRTAG